MEFKVHEFNTVSDASEFIAVVNAGEGIPASPDSQTLTYTVPFEHGGKFYIYADDVTRKYSTNETVINIKRIGEQ